MNYRYTPINNELFIKNRKKFIDKLLPNSIAFFNSNDIYQTGADSTVPFEQHRDIFYLSGINQEDSILVLYPSAYKEEHKEMLFLTETNETIKIWEGEKYTKEKARETSGIENIYWLNEFETIMNRLIPQSTNIYLNLNEHYRASKGFETKDDRFTKKIMSDFPLHQYHRSNPILQRLRSIKEPEEIELIQQACNITEKGFRRILTMIKPGVWEYEIEAELIHEFIKNKSKGFAYTPIIASGANSNVLHYIANNQQCKAGDLLLLDIAAEYALYSSDLTRTVPISGKFTKRQLQVYNAVLSVKDQATKLLQVGNNWYSYHEEVGEIMTDELLKLELITKKEVEEQNPKYPVYKKYFMHGTSHHMGLDTHDYGILEEPFEVNMVLTVEPGIYIPEEGFGIRIEDDVVIQEHGEPFNLMKNIPILPQEIEYLMNN